MWNALLWLWLILPCSKSFKLLLSSTYDVMPPTVPLIAKPLLSSSASSCLEADAGCFTNILSIPIPEVVLMRYARFLSRCVNLSSPAVV